MIILATALILSCVSAGTTTINLAAYADCARSTGCSTGSFNVPFLDDVVFTGNAGVSYVVNWDAFIFASSVSFPADDLTVAVNIRSGGTLYSMHGLVAGAKVTINNVGGKINVLSATIRGGYYSNAVDAINGGGFQFASTAFGRAYYLNNIGGAPCTLAGRMTVATVYTHGALTMDASRGLTVNSVNLNAGPYSLVNGGMNINSITVLNTFGSTVQFNLGAGTSLAVLGGFSISDTNAHVTFGGSGRVDFLGDVLLAASTGITAAESSIVDIHGATHGTGSFNSQDSATAEVFLQADGSASTLVGNYVSI